MAQTRSQDKKPPAASKKPGQATKATVKSSTKPTAASKKPSKVTKSTVRPSTKPKTRQTTKSSAQPVTEPTRAPKSNRRTSYKLLSPHAEMRLRGLAGFLSSSYPLGQQVEIYAARIALLQNDMKSDYHAIGLASFGLDQTKRVLRNFAKDYYRDLEGGTANVYEPENMEE
ncbi:hypothetical protein CLAFUW4_04871 [Fulvia fulva]|uniref:Uncharacterized protein n=1 Tax=Passalora fulva TaxID=5499 RepID=A0A9Q8UU73_PASFU|nr:uncharacterized protein CLAFUR5_12034 [Fulvia fulva]KAK4626088.1 hypothetical protein CLAFUR4_04857 [Fulvia fulva]KAK4627576.1 hypothetical protein CLAFUR0_04861 [Fulvia fulva]UJO22631.1 hypothetical protein CLAFUR5_12034 [Fulvia fulva]WPV13380.1 hypothetical protein CLAFUW4_04871 [Fulvia fulva]WPV29287.1 hypothetical protein CLAFUW7_04865 [Fulvia fulva]